MTDEQYQYGIIFLVGGEKREYSRRWANCWDAYEYAEELASEEENVTFELFRESRE